MSENEAKNIYTSFEICYSLGKKLGYEVVDIRGENCSWFRFKDKNDKYILVKYALSESSQIGFNDITKIIDKINTLIIIYKDENEKYTVNEIDMTNKSILTSETKKGYIKVKENKAIFYPNNIININYVVKEKKDITIEDNNIGLAVSRYKSIMERNYEQRLNYFLFKLSLQISYGLVDIPKKKKVISTLFYQKEKLLKEFTCELLRENFEKNVDCNLMKKYAHQYKNMKKIRNRNKLFEALKNDFSKILKEYESCYSGYYQNNILPFDDFYKLWNQKDRSCAYCGVSEKQIHCLDENNKIETKRYYSRGKTMEIDKIYAFGQYKECNIILSCYWCNNAKTDEYSLAEFQPIAKGINCVWNQRLKGITVSKCNNTVKFPVATYKQKDKKGDNCNEES